MNNNPTFVYNFSEIELHKLQNKTLNDDTFRLIEDIFTLKSELNRYSEALTFLTLLAKAEREAGDN